MCKLHDYILQIYNKLTHRTLKNVLIPFERVTDTSFVLILLRLDGIKLRTRKEVNGASLGTHPHSATHPRMAAGLQESPRTSPQSRCACASQLGSDAHLRLAAGL